MRIERRLKSDVNIDLTPLIDVVYQLVIFFMITSVFKVAPGIALTLPGAATATSISATELRIVAISEDEIYVGKERTSLAGLDSLVGKAIEGRERDGLKAVLEGDRNMPYQLMVSVLDALRANGIEGVGLSTLPSPKDSSPGKSAGAPAAASTNSLDGAGPEAGSTAGKP